MIRTIGPTSKECVTKLILKLKLLKNYFTIISLTKLMATRVKRGKSSTILHLARPSSIREINLNGTTISESSDLSNAFNDHFSSIGPKLANDIPLSNNRDFTQRRRECLTTAFATERNWDDNLVLSTVKVTLRNNGFQDGVPYFWREIQNTILGLELSLFIGLLRFICQIVHFKTWINNQ